MSLYAISALKLPAGPFRKAWAFFLAVLTFWPLLLLAGFIGLMADVIGG